MATSTPASHLNVAPVVDQTVEAIRRNLHKTMPPPDGMRPDLLMTAEILGQDPGRRRPLGAAGTAFAGAWAQAGAAAERIAIVDGDSQVAVIGSNVVIPPKILVTDGFGRPCPGVAVNVVATAGGKVTPGSLATAQDGVASVTAWSLGATPGVNLLQFKIGNRTVAVVTAFAVATRRCDIVDGDGQNAAHGTALKNAPTVKVVDVATGQPVSDVNVNFQVTAGGGSVSNPTSKTDNDGIASCGTWTLGQSTGTNTLEADVLEAAPTTFTAQAT
jgi:5-hydroxyisourate hydrolase-like protein (transthyretin family)